MDAGKLAWYSKKKKGIKIVKPNENLAKENLESAEENLLILQDIAASQICGLQQPHIILNIFQYTHYCRK